MTDADAVDVGAVTLGQMRAELLRTGEVPFIHVQVLLNRKEYEEMRAAAHLTARGTCSEVIRQRLGLYGTPYGYIKWNRMRWKALQ